MGWCGVVSGEGRRGVRGGRRCGMGGRIGRGVGGGLVGRIRGRVGGGRGRGVLGRGGAFAMLGRGVLEEIGDVHGRVVDDEDGGGRENQNSKTEAQVLASRSIHVVNGIEIQFDKHPPSLI